MTKVVTFLSLAMVMFLSVDRVFGGADEASDKAFQMAAKYSAMGYYVAPSKEGWAGFGVTLEFTIPVNAGIDYIFILGGDKYLLDPDVWIESEYGNTIVKDTRKYDNGMCGVRWRSDYNGTANVVVHFARATSRCAWAAVMGRRGTSTNRVPNEFGTAAPSISIPTPGKPVQPVGGADAP
ncbi:MAG: hypothetical protein QOE70_450 [Chthoniobacter sp.]|jgi:hypothetical protein|nr:hypothetical protein [Chthoniobacter sp.]